MAADPWLTIIGLGEDGLAGLTDASRAALDGAEIVFGGPRHLALAGAGARGRDWPVPFDIAPVLACRGRPVAVLASGDPFWFGAGGSLAAQLEPGEWQAHPVPGSVSLAAARLGWRIEETDCLGLHAAPLAVLRARIAPCCRIIATQRDGRAPAELAQWLAAQGFGAMRMVVLERLGGPAERVREARAAGFKLSDIAAPVVVALCGADLPRGSGLARAAGLPDSDFAHDGQITRSAVRALTLAALAPRRGEALWDIGGGSGSISVEWALAGGRATCIEPRADRIATIRANIDGFGLQGRVAALQGSAPEALEGLAAPDAVFLGGGASAGLLDRLWTLLPPGARLVANAVTLDSEALLAAMQARQGGRLLRIDLAEAQPLGRMRGWQPQRPVVQWAVTR
ncbi:precorrin-6y C5,15-methyltransferase (decarboxylating) subunit CbiE [Paracoccus spongiarum]|uniref:Precorrin-6y C5,15-methyltransferase (Decarboxylating) subunit CbiE n=1 Tax=Paracoccus spongiarum TaxID=3064387 RepID=A0ABT9JAV7_9RHOB|nr:precorrin-6y C5,15-methyltransferase (decarboxylating) subunit CbiE [Paracoccus sp. 2205BS29-5]MDP5306940.1 precorrin-6y C5,15-methyltransferase (decarboxylating) subunit CbiE [Paracoccus sp. 2205BS29-5]